MKFKMLKKIPTVGDNTEEASNESKDVQKTTGEGQVIYVEDTTQRGKDKNAERINNGMIEAVKEGESESGEQTAKEGQKAFIEDTPKEEECEHLEDTSSEDDSDSGEETTSEDEDEATRQTINQENKVDMNKIVTYYGKLSVAQFVGLVPVEKSNNEMTPTETNSGNINHERVNKENSITVSPKTMAIHVQESQPTPEVEKRPGRTYVI